ncbi:16S rRNA (cytosine(967)-C(5))-methyltransferase [Pseudanabaena sp. PCC 6802]|uniref:16S rRNA (cytosine(967)-C(5))-methyltransferase n=1 Tax=Pseudanabaena sp. PCC 6802 TaxID=118173 RepID=UPI00034C2C93|nr:16S rRNA (cytosine(967)-C(5))-methyltransferase [Pseudanabaena sp. PCC 6802]
MSSRPRQLAFEALRSISQRGAYADVALDRVLSRSHNPSQSHSQSQDLTPRDRHLTTELVYGVTRRQRTLDALIDRFARQPAHKQPPDLRLILQLGIYQICFLDLIPPSAAVNTSVDLAKHNKLAGLAGLVNAVLRAISTAKQNDTLWSYLEDKGLGIKHSFPDWLIQLWQDKFGADETEKLCQWFNRSPHIDLRVNRLRSHPETVLSAFAKAGITAIPLPHIPYALRLPQGAGAIADLPGYNEGWWSVQDASAQLAALLLDPQPHEVIIDACAAPGGKTTHIAELMGNEGKIWACDRSAQRLQKLQQNCDRLGLTNIKIRDGDSRKFTDFENSSDRVLLDVPCSGLGTLHRHADARWRQTPNEPDKLHQIQIELLERASKWVKPSGSIVYSTCTLHPVENELVIQQFLAGRSDWQLGEVAPTHPAAQFLTPSQWIEVIPHHHDMDGFFMARLEKL